MYGLEGIHSGDGFTLMFAGMAVVFVALVALLFLMKSLKQGLEMLHAATSRRAAAREAKLTAARGDQADESGIRAIEGPGGKDVSGVEIAAIAMTLLFESEQVHDNESMVLTLHGLPKPYSSWWQSRIDPAWHPALTQGRPATLQTRDPERGTRV
jgi:Na+-transporting methylmalonyl-CoA/oxaloacetate decarboxylase gamma subunit